MFKKLAMRLFIFISFFVVVNTIQLQAGGFGKFMGGAGHQIRDEEDSHYEYSESSQPQSHESSSSSNLLKYINVEMGIIVLLIGGVVFFVFRRQKKSNISNEDQSHPISMQKMAHAPMGQVLFYDAVSEQGTITASDRKRYRFSGSDVKIGLSDLAQGKGVDFVINEDGTVTEIIVIGAEGASFESLEEVIEPTVPLNIAEEKEASRDREYVDISSVANPLFVTKTKTYILKNKWIALSVLAAIIFLVWFMMFRAVHVSRSEIKFSGYSSLSVAKAPWRVNFYVDSPVKVKLQIPKDALEYIEEKDGKKVAHLYVGFKKKKEGLLVRKNNTAEIWKNTDEYSVVKFNDNGTVRYRIHFHNIDRGGMIKDGPMAIYDANGKVIDTLNFKNNATKYKTYYSNGKIASEVGLNNNTHSFYRLTYYASGAQFCSTEYTEFRNGRNPDVTSAEVFKQICRSENDTMPEFTYESSNYLDKSDDDPYPASSERELICGFPLGTIDTTMIDGKACIDRWKLPLYPKNSARIVPLITAQAIAAPLAEEERLEQIVNLWSEAHNTQDSNEFSKIFGEKVKFYGQKLAKKTVLNEKVRLFEKYPNFHQEIVGSIDCKAESDSALYRCDFTKSVTFGSKQKEFPSYLVIDTSSNEPSIITESDKITDQNIK